LSFVYLNLDESIHLAILMPVSLLVLACESTIDLLRKATVMINLNKYIQLLPLNSILDVSI